MTWYNSLWLWLTLTLKMTTAQVVETSVTVNNNCPIQDYVHPDDQTQPFEMTPGFKPFTEVYLADTLFEWKTARVNKKPSGALISLWARVGVTSNWTMGDEFWVIFLPNLVRKKIVTASPETAPQCISTQHRPSLTRKLNWPIRAQARFWQSAYIVPLVLCWQHKYFPLPFPVHFPLLLLLFFFPILPLLWRLLQGSRKGWIKK